MNIKDLQRAGDELARLRKVDSQISDMNLLSAHPLFIEYRNVKLCFEQPENEAFRVATVNALKARREAILKRLAELGVEPD